MSGFSTSRFGLNSVAKQYGSILRGYGPPVPKAGVVGDLYIDVLTFQLFEKRSDNSLDGWGHYLFTVPSTYRNTLKWFGASRPSNTIGIFGDYFLQWGGYNNYGMQLTIFGPKAVTGWLENGDGSGVIITTDRVDQLGLLNDGSPLPDMMPNQLIAVGLSDEYVIPLSVTANPGEVVAQVGLPNSGQLVITEINPLYTAEDEHAI